MIRRFAAAAALAASLAFVPSVPAHADDPAPTRTCDSVEDMGGLCSGTFSTAVRQGLLMRSINGGPWAFVTPTSYYLGEIDQCHAAFGSAHSEAIGLRSRVEVASTRLAHAERRIDRQAATIARLRARLAH